MTGQNPLHHGLLRPPMYGEPGGFGGAETVASILKELGYTTQGVGKWHMGEVEGSVPNDVGLFTRVSSPPCSSPIRRNTVSISAGSLRSIGNR